VNWQLRERRLYLCTPDRPDLESFLVACIKGGIDIVQLRDKEADARTIISRAKLARAVCNDHGVPFILNDRPDLALEVGADGVHVGQEDAPPGLARQILGEHAIVGLSTHSVPQLSGAMGAPVDYLSAGPVEATPTKPGRPGTGIEYIEAATAIQSLPIFVTGGVTPKAIPDLWAVGARHFVVVRYLTEAADPVAAARQLRSAIEAQR
jgi:thiamine-phosphate pyrophosphorylase